MTTDVPLRHHDQQQRLSGSLLAIILALTASIVLAVAAAPARAATPDAGAVITGFATPIDRQIELSSQLGVGWVTLPMSWSFYEAEPDAHLTPGTDQAERWEQLGSQLARAKALGLNVQVTFSTTPPWAREFASPQSGPAPERFGDFAQFVAEVAATYGPLIDAYATWNEPNIGLFWLDPDPAAYAQLHIQAASNIRANDRTAIVVLGPFAGNVENSFPFVTRVYATGVRGTVNRLGWNIYPPGAPWIRGGRESYDGFSTALAALLRRVDPGRQAWIGETGWSTCGGCSPAMLNVASPANQADYLLSALAIKRRYMRGLVDRIFIYSLADGANRAEWAQNHGLVGFDFIPKPAYPTFQRASATLTRPNLRFRRTATGTRGAIRNLQLRSRRGVVRATARLEPAGRAQLRVSGYWRGRWRDLEARAARDGGVAVSIPDVGYLVVRMQIGRPGAGWVTVQMPVPAGPKLSTSSS